MDWSGIFTRRSCGSINLCGIGGLSFPSIIPVEQGWEDRDGWSLSACTVTCNGISVECSFEVKVMNSLNCTEVASMIFFYRD